MQISINKNKYCYYKPIFKAKINTKCMDFRPEDFYVNIDGYGKNNAWAEQIIAIADFAVKCLKGSLPIETVLSLIASGVAKANELTDSFMKQTLTGKLRTYRKGWETEQTELYTPYMEKPYVVYAEKLNKIADKPLKNPYKDIDLSKINDMFEIEHGNSEAINSAMDRVIDLSDSLIKKYKNEKIKQEDLKEINSTIAEIRWILAHSTMWFRGSDSISNTFMRALYKTLNIKSYPLKSGITLDLEAYCTELDDYKKNFIKYFENTTEIVK